MKIFELMDDKKIKLGENIDINVISMLATIYDSKIREMAIDFIKTDGEIMAHARNDEEPTPVYKKGSPEHPSYTAYYVMLWNNIDCYSLKPKEFWQLQNATPSLNKVNELIKQKVGVLELKDDQILFNILEKVEDTLRMELRRYYYYSDFPDWDFHGTPKYTKAPDVDIFKKISKNLQQLLYPLSERNISDVEKGGSRKRRKSICKNYNKKCKHNTKKHKIIHKKTKRQKYQKRK